MNFSFVTGAATFKRTMLAGLLFTLAGCGVSYYSPSVKETSNGDPVTVVALTAQTVAAANSSDYTPRQLPAAFFAAAGAGSGAIGAGAMPSEPYLPSETREQLDYRPLPDITPAPYTIGIGDVLLLATRSAGTTVEQLSGLLAAQSRRQGYTVRDDGSIAIPEVGTVQLAGLTIQQAEDALFQVLVNNQIDPSFSLEVADFNSKRVAIGGAVNNATLVPITLQTLTLSDALTAAGGLNVKNREFASIRVYRDGTLYQMPVSMYLERSDLQKKVLQNGDAVFVDTTYDLDRAISFYKTKLDVIALRSSARGQSLQALDIEVNLRRSALNEQRSTFELRESLGAQERDYVYLTGEVNKQSRFALPYGHHATLADVLFGEGGFDTTTGNPAEIYVLRSQSASSDAITAYHLNATNAAALVMATRLEMRPNDVIFIEEQPITKWNRALQQLFPSLLQAAQNAI